MQVLYHLIYTSSPILLLGLMFFPGLALDHHPPTYRHWPSWVYRHDLGFLLYFQ
jgi:hypothetical protein